MVEEAVWVNKKCVGPRLRLGEVLLMYRLVDNHRVPIRHVLVGWLRLKFNPHTQE
jgi:hypothetical protein